MSKIDKLRDDIRQWDFEYYVNDNPTIPDHVYDAAYKELVALEAASEEPIPADSPTQRVGGIKSDKFQPYKHTPALYSLDNALNIEELEAWLADYPEDTEFVMELKMDGLACNCVYKDGQLIAAATRGDGTVGELVTNNARTIHDIPLKLPEPFNVSIRGEVYLSKDNLVRLRETETDPKRKHLNTRNSAAGAFRTLDPKRTAYAKLNFMAYECVGLDGQDLEVSTQVGKMELLKEFGLPYSANNVMVTRTEVVDKVLNHFTKLRSDLPYDIDGIVIKLNDIKGQEDLGFTNRAPKWAIAYKFPPETAESELLRVDWQVGQHGTITPVAKIRPTFVGGVTVSSITLHNISKIEELNARIGSTLVIQRAGDVVPQIVTATNAGETSEIEPPTKCPSCGGITELVEQNDSTTLVCNNIGECPAQALRWLERSVGRRCMNVDGLGGKLLYKLYTAGYVKNPMHIFELTKSVLLKMDEVKDKSATNVLNAIADAKTMELWRFINTLGIRGIDHSKAKDIANHMRTADAFINGQFKDFLEIYGIGVTIGENITEYLENNQPFINALYNAVHVQDVETKTGVLTGKVICITGTHPVGRTEITAIVESLGGSVANSVSKKTDILLAPSSESNSSKYKKALNPDFNVTILNYDEFKTQYLD